MLAAPEPVSSGAGCHVHVEGSSLEERCAGAVRAEEPGALAALGWRLLQRSCVSGQDWPSRR